MMWTAQPATANKVVPCERLMPPRLPLRIALLHLAPVPGDLAHNRALIEQGLVTAAKQGARWVVTPELSICGYGFAPRIGTAWIVPQPDVWTTSLCRLTARLDVTCFLGQPERDPRTGHLYNSLFVLAANGTIAGTHRKINALRTGSEAWSTPGTVARPIPVSSFGSVGLLICADAYTRRIATSLQAQGAQFLVSAAAWAPGQHGPNGEWEQCTRDTGLPLVVCNRTGPDLTLDFTKAESVVVAEGRRVLTASSSHSTILLFDWDLDAQALVPRSEQRVRL